MPSLYMNGRNYTGSGSGEGGGNVYGAFIDTNRVIQANTTFNSDTSYTATEDCAIVYSIAVNTGTNGQVLVDGEQISAFYSGNGIMQPTDIIYLKTGQTILFKPTYSAGTSSYTVYGLAFGEGSGNSIGVFIDTKKIIKAETQIPANIDVTYTATEDCAVSWALIAAQNSSYTVYIDNVSIASGWTQTGARSNQDTVFLKTGQTIKFRQSYTDSNGIYTVYGVNFGSNSIKQHIENAFGVFIDTNRVIKARTTVEVGTTETYTATEDCMVIAEYYGKADSGDVSVDGVVVSQIYCPQDAQVNNVVRVPLRKGQTISIKTRLYSGGYTVYGLTFGTQNIFTPQIYSTEERCVGVWIDNKPLYQKTYNIPQTILETTGTVISSISVSGMSLINGLAVERTNNQATPVAVYTENNTLKVAPPIRFLVDSITIWYTKTTDTAGSGSYNTLGVPMVHYSTDEQVVGTDEDGNTIYEKTFKVTSPTWSHGSGFSTIAVDISSIGTADKLNFVRGTVYDNTDDRMFSIPYFRVENSESLLYECRINSDGTPYFVLFVRHSSGAGYSLSDLSVTLQYTKSSS